MGEKLVFGFEFEFVFCLTVGERVEAFGRRALYIELPVDERNLHCFHSFSYVSLFLLQEPLLTKVIHLVKLIHQKTFLIYSRKLNKS